MKHPFSAPDTKIRRAPKQKRIVIPVHGDMNHNAGIYLAIGSLVVHWANNESVFCAMLQALMRGERHSADIVWYSQRTTKARLDLLLRLARVQVKDATLISDLKKAAANFKGLSRVRNLYCHGMYTYDEQLRLVGLSGITVADEGEPLRLERKPFNSGTMNELSDTINKSSTLNRALWALVPRLESALGAPPVPPPHLPPQS
jgi:hypothetical protein